MELAAAQGFDVKVVTLPRGQDPADAPDGFAERLGSAESYLFYRVRLEIERSADRQEAFVRVREVLGDAEDSPERQEALRLLADRLDLPRETLAGLAPARGGAARRADDAPRLLERATGWSATCSPPASRIRRSCAGSPSCRPTTSTRSANRRFRDMLVTGRDDPELTALRAELDARAAQEAIDERTGTELLLRLRERKLKRDLSGADLARTTELQAHLAKVRQALAELTVDVARARGAGPASASTSASCSSHRGLSRTGRPTIRALARELGQRLDRSGELRREHGGDGGGVGGHILVANLDHLRTARARCGHVAPPHPCRPARVARALELLPPLGLDPEAGVGAVGNAGVVDAAPAPAKPRLLEQRADDVAPVANDVHDLRLGVGERERSDEVRELRRLLDGANRADETDATRDGEDPSQRRAASAVGARQARERGLDRRHLAEVDEAGQRADRAREERRPRAWRAEDEHEPIVQPAEALAERGATPGREALGDAEVVRGRLENAVHRGDSRSGGWTSCPPSSSVAPLELCSSRRRSLMALARVVAFDGVTDERIAQLKSQIEGGDPQPEGLNATEMLLLHNSGDAKTLAIVFFDSEEDYARGDEILSAMPRTTRLGSARRYRSTTSRCA